MAKIADIYYGTDPWRILEEGFDETYAQVSESIFSLANEYMGVRGYFDEGYTGNSLIGSYFNGIYETQKVPASHYKGIIDTTEFIVNSVDWLYTRIMAEQELLDLAFSTIKDFHRELNMRTGILTRSFVWVLKDGKELKLEFERFLSMKNAHLAGQRISMTPLNFSGTVTICAGLDFSNPHFAVGENLWNCGKIESGQNWCSILGETRNTKKSVYSYCRFTGDMDKETETIEEKRIYKEYTFRLKQLEKKQLTRSEINIANKDSSEAGYQAFLSSCKDAAARYEKVDYDSAREESIQWWDRIWEASDIVIQGDELNQQGIRYCIFQMHQTYHGADEGTIIGAKGLTGEAYSGNTFWDTETYCLPFYLFTNTDAARNLLKYRYLTLEEAKLRAQALDCDGAFYPIATISGRECCSLWQHASLQLQASTAVAYAIRHYEKITGDTEFINQYGAPILIEVSRMLATRGDWNASHTGYGFYGVMGPDEFQMMVHNNCYTNYMGKASLDYTLLVLARMKQEQPEEYRQILERHSLVEEEITDWKKKSEGMVIPYDENTLLFEQHEGYFTLPHIDVDSIPQEEFPLYSHWTYDRIYRNDMIKQPDVLMLMLLYNGSFTQEQLQKNYEFYEPRCIHESSLSPSVHSILALQLHKHEEAYKFFGFATRMDLDNYNRNTAEGLHTTSIAAAWMNIVYGFGGMRSDGDGLSFAPSIPADWRGYSFRVDYRKDVILVEVDRENAVFSTRNGTELVISVYGKQVICSREKIRIQIPGEWRG